MPRGGRLRCSFPSRLFCSNFCLSPAQQENSAKYTLKRSSRTHTPISTDTCTCDREPVSSTSEQKGREGDSGTGKAEALTFSLPGYAATFILGLLLIYLFSSLLRAEVPLSHCSSGKNSTSPQQVVFPPPPPPFLHTQIKRNSEQNGRGELGRGVGGADGGGGWYGRSPTLLALQRAQLVASQAQARRKLPWEGTGLC